MPDVHAFLSASSSGRWIAFPPSARLCVSKPDAVSTYAQQGTDALSLCEYLLLTALGRNAKDPTEDLTYYDEEMQSCAESYRDFCLEQITDDEAYANAYFLNANSTTKPGIVDANSQPIIDTSELYSGIYGRASVNFYAFNSNGNRGVACGLNALQKLRDGEPLGGHINAETEFAGLDGDDADDDFLS